MGAYLKMKGECSERLVRESGLAWTLFRPSSLVSPKGATASAHGAREVPAAARLLPRRRASAGGGRLGE